MSFTVPNAVNYASPLNAVPLDWTSPPVEGAKGIQCSIQWNASQSGANKAVYVNCQNNATLNFSKIRALIIDNSQCGADIEIIFPDTETTISIPAYTPYAIVPVFTNQTQFYVVGTLAQSNDKSAFTILNTAPPPIAVPTTQEQNVSAIAPLNVAAASGTDTIVPNTVDGTLETAFIYYDLSASTSDGIFTWQLQDGNSKIVAQGITSVIASQFAAGILYQVFDVRVRFQKGLVFVWTSSNLLNGYISPNLYYRTP